MHYGNRMIIINVCVCLCLCVCARLFWGVAKILDSRVTQSAHMQSFSCG